MNKHVHKYIRTKYGSKGYVVYKCVLPCCTHFIDEKLVMGRNSICWRCGAEHVIVQLYKKPHCSDCTKSKKVIQKQDLGLLEHFQSLLREV